MVIRITGPGCPGNEMQKGRPGAPGWDPPTCGDWTGAQRPAREVTKKA